MVTAWKPCSSTLTAFTMRRAWRPPPQDEPQIVDGWIDLQRDHEVRLEVCIAAALRRGIIDAAEAARHGKDGHSLAPPFTLTGLGQLIDLGVDCDRLITFGA